MKDISAHTTEHFLSVLWIFPGCLLDEISTKLDLHWTVSKFYYKMRINVLMKYSLIGIEAPAPIFEFKAVRKNKLSKNYIT